MKKMDSVSNLVIGLGQIGTAIASILKCDGIDKDQIADKKSYTFLHICIPYSDIFIETVEGYQEKYSPQYTVIHSTVPIGTCRKLNAVHSPVRGVHPNLEDGIRTFVKYFGGFDSYICALQFGERGVKTKVIEHSDETETMKLFDTFQYGMLLLMQKEIHKYCQNKKLNFDLVYTEANKTYNEGYIKLGRPDVVRPYLKHMEGKIGGHCIIPNAKLLDFWMAKTLVEFNDGYAEI